MNRRGHISVNKPNVPDFNTPSMEIMTKSPFLKITCNITSSYNYMMKWCHLSIIWNKNYWFPFTIHIPNYIKSNFINSLHKSFLRGLILQFKCWLQHKFTPFLKVLRPKRGFYKPFEPDIWHQKLVIFIHKYYTEIMQPKRN